MKTPTIETARLVLRPPTVSDAEIVYKNWTNDTRVTQYMRWNAHNSIDETKSWLKSAITSEDIESRFDWLIVLKETGEPIGSGGLYYNEKHNMYELGYCVAYDYWGQGIATEASQAWLNFAQKTLLQNKFFACHAQENISSGKVLEKLGFVYKNDGEYTSFDGLQVFKSRRYFIGE